MLLFLNKCRYLCLNAGIFCYLMLMFQQFWMKLYFESNKYREEIWMAMETMEQALILMQ